MMQAQNKKNKVNRLASTRKSALRGFTLTELLIVLAVVALVSALSFAGFSSLTNSNRRTSCQANMTQIYAAVRQYAADEGGFPFYRPTATAPDNKGIGLWALFAFPDANDFDRIAPPPASDVAFPRPLERYLRASRNLHCPADTDQTNLTMPNPLDPTGTDPDEADIVYNPDYLSYQVEDPDNAGIYTYQPERTDDRSDAAWRRQLLHFDSALDADGDGNPDLVRRPPMDNTIVTWCSYHRSGSTPLDNVLFYDGSVQVVPTGAGGAELWKRIPKNPS